MARPRQPIELIKVKGKSHLTKAKIEAREKHELKVDLKDITIPKYLPSKLKKSLKRLPLNNVEYLQLI